LHGFGIRITTRNNNACSAASDWVGGVRFSPYADLLITAAGKELRAWTLDGQSAARHPAACQHDHFDLAWHPRQAAAGFVGFGKLHLWDWRAAEALPSNVCHRFPRPESCGGHRTDATWCAAVRITACVAGFGQSPRISK
jgi:hypothetical protein